MQVGPGPGHIVLDGDPAAPSPKAQSPQFSTHICCGQICEWLKMPLGMEVGLVPGNFVLDGDPAPLRQKLGGATNFRPMSIVAKQLYGSRWHLAWCGPRSRPHCATWGPSSSPRKMGHSPPQFSAHVYCG